MTEPDGSQLTNPKQLLTICGMRFNAVPLAIFFPKRVDKTVLEQRIFMVAPSCGILPWMSESKRWWPILESVGSITSVIVESGNMNFHRGKSTKPRTGTLSLAVAPQAHAPHIKAASLWLNGSNDHHGRHEQRCDNFKKNKQGIPWDFAVQARGHHNTEKLGDTHRLWLEKHVRGDNHFWPGRPSSKIILGTHGIPELHLTPANTNQIKEVQIFQCLKTANNIARFWRDVESKRVGNSWTAKLPVMNVDDYVFSYANIRYANNLVISSDFEAVIPSRLGNAVATDQKTDELPGGASLWSFAAPAEGVGGIQGFRPINNHRGTSSAQFADPKWKAPTGASLEFMFYCTQPQNILLNTDSRHTTNIKITASNDWQTMVIHPNDLGNDHGTKLDDWSKVGKIELRPKPEPTLQKWYLPILSGKQKEVK